MTVFAHCSCRHEERGTLQKYKVLTFYYEPNANIINHGKYNNLTANYSVFVAKYILLF